MHVGLIEGTFGKTGKFKVRFDRPVFPKGQRPEGYTLALHYHPGWQAALRRCLVVLHWCPSFFIINSMRLRLHVHLHMDAQMQKICIYDLFHLPKYNCFVQMGDFGDTHTYKHAPIHTHKTLTHAHARTRAHTQTHHK